jgi:hypothetical protein
MAGVANRLGAGFNVKLLGVGAAVVAGTFVTNVATQWVASNVFGRFGIGFLSNMAGPGSYITQLLTTGAMTWAASKVAPRYAALVLVSGVIDTVSRIANMYVKPLVARTLPSLVQMTGIGDYLTVGDARRARKLRGMDFLTVENALAARPLEGMDDYLTVGDARRARKLRGMGDDMDGIHGEDAEMSELETSE